MVTLDFKTGIGPYEDFTDSYMEVGFAPSSGNIIARVGTLTLQTRFYGPDFNMMFTQTNDYSFDPTKTAFTDWSRVTLYRNGRLIWGTEPRAN
jgi:cellulose 1,4-beta-cellobiosidase